MNYSDATRTILNDGSVLAQDRSNVPYGENLRFICSYIFAHPGCKITAVKRALVEARGWTYTDKIRGKYASYFYDVYARKMYYEKLWTQTRIEAGTRNAKGCFLREQGLARVDLSLVERIRNISNVS